MDFIRELGPLVLDHRFKRMKRMLLQEADRIYDRLKLPFKARWVSTYLLLKENGALSITQLAHRIGVTHPAVIQIVRDMMKVGLVAERKDTNDGRKRLLVLTDKGQALAPILDRTWQVLATVQEAVFLEAGCAIVDVMTRVEDLCAVEPLSERVLEHLKTDPLFIDG